MRTRRQGLIGVLVLGLLGGWAGVGAAGGVSKAEWCEASKLTAAGLKASCLAIEEAKGVLGATPRPERCDAAFTKAFTKAEKVAGAGVCPTEGDAAAVEALVDGCVAEIADALSGGGAPNGCSQFPATGQTTCWDPADIIAPIDPIACTGTGQDGDIRAGATLSFNDNGDGTITDDNTGLMWEKLCDENSPGGTCPAEHDVDTTYTWAEAFAVKIAALNAGAGFAGYTDWRLSNVKELQSIVNHENFDPAVSSAFNNSCVANCSVLNCSCTRATSYWSSTSVARVPTDAWTVFFGSGGGDVDVHNLKGDFNSVRAVRGGL
jgi:hypothetical protein